MVGKLEQMLLDRQGSGGGQQPLGGANGALGGPMPQAQLDEIMRNAEAGGARKRAEAPVNMQGVGDGWSPAGSGMPGSPGNPNTGVNGGGPPPVPDQHVNEPPFWMQKPGQSQPGASSGAASPPPPPAMGSGPMGPKPMGVPPAPPMGAPTGGPEMGTGTPGPGAPPIGQTPSWMNMFNKPKFPGIPQR